MSLSIRRSQSKGIAQALSLTPPSFEDDRILSQDSKKDTRQIPHYGAIKPVMPAVAPSSSSKRQDRPSPSWLLEMPPTPPHTTVSPNDDDGGLYLLWTHQLLRENGFDPKKASSSDSDEEDDEDSDDRHSTVSSDSSLTDDESNDGDGSTTLRPRSMFSTEHDDSRLQMFSPFSNTISPSTPASLMLTASAVSSLPENEEQPTQTSWFATLTSCFSAC